MKLKENFDYLYLKHLYTEYEDCLDSMIKSNVCRQAIKGLLELCEKLENENNVLYEHNYIHHNYIHNDFVDKILINKILKEGK